MNHIWIMSSAFEGYDINQHIEFTNKIGASGVELCIFGKNSDRVSNHHKILDYDNFNTSDASELISELIRNKIGISLSSYENILGSEADLRESHLDHLLKVIRMAYLLGGDENNVKVGTFVGFNKDIAYDKYGFQKNLEEYQKVFAPVVDYAESLGVTILYENCPMEGWSDKSEMHTYNNLPATLAARKLMYALIPSSAHGETYDPSHDIWQDTNPVDVIKESDISRIHRVHIKDTLKLNNNFTTHWGKVFPAQYVDPDLAKKAGIRYANHNWKRHPYKAVLPGFGYTGMNWDEFIQELRAKGYNQPLVIENEAFNSAQALGDEISIQGFKSTINYLSPLLYKNDKDRGVVYKRDLELKTINRPNIPITNYKNLTK